MDEFRVPVEDVISGEYAIAAAVATLKGCSVSPDLSRGSAGRDVRPERPIGRQGDVDGVSRLNDQTPDRADQGYLLRGLAHEIES